MNRLLERDIHRAAHAAADALQANMTPRLRAHFEAAEARREKAHRKYLTFVRGWERQHPELAQRLAARR